MGERETGQVPDGNQRLQEWTQQALGRPSILEQTFPETPGLWDPELFRPADRTDSLQPFAIGIYICSTAPMIVEALMDPAQSSSASWVITLTPLNFSASQAPRLGVWNAGGPSHTTVVSCQTSEKPQTRQAVTPGDPRQLVSRQPSHLTLLPLLFCREVSGLLKVMGQGSRDP